MGTNLLVDDLAEAVLHEMGRLSLNPTIISEYQRACDEIKAFAAARGADSFSPALGEEFLHDVEKRYKAGRISHYKRRFFRRTARALEDYFSNRTISNRYVFKQQPMPSSQEFLSALSRFLEHLRSLGRSKDTIRTFRRLVQQFLVFLQDCGCGSLATASSERVPEFFQHLLASYRPTSMSTVASKIRGFLRFAEGGTKLLRAVPSRWTTAKTIIPILSGEELMALKEVLDDPAVPLRDRAIILLALRTGLRAVDIVGLKLTDIDWVNDTLTVVQSKTRTALTLPMSVDVGNVLSAYILTERPDTNLPQVFFRYKPPIGPLGGSDACYAIVRRTFRLAGIRLGGERKGIHVIRHTVASRMLANGIPVTTNSFGTRSCESVVVRRLPPDGRNTAERLRLESPRRHSDLRGHQMSKEYTSSLAVYLSGLVATKRAVGYAYQTAEDHLHDFDRFCCRRGASSSLSREVVLEWVAERKGEGPKARRRRMSTIRELGRYMQSIGASDAFVLPSGLSPKIARYMPHFLTDEEISAFFAACDRFLPHQTARARHLVLPALFRLLYCCGLRVGEARTLRVEQVDLHGGHIDILQAKGCRSRRLPLSDELLHLLKVYDEAVAAIYPRRIYFFPRNRSTCYSPCQLDSIFRSVWKAAGLEVQEGKRARLYDVRHHFAFANLNRWIAAGKDPNVLLPYLSRYMGHAGMESTDYYLHLVPAFFHTFRDEVKSTETLLPEPDYE